MRHPTSACWFSTRPLGHNPLGNTVARMCKAAGIKGFKTNHSLRATATSRLYRSGVDEQLVMERTGHRSIEGVRSYKRTSETQREVLSDILNMTKHPKLHDDTTLQQPTLPPATPEHPPHTLIERAAQHSQQLQGLSFPSLTFNNCTITFNVGSVTQVHSVK